MYGTAKVVKSKVDVQVELNTGKQFLGAFFLRRNQRISEVLNDERVFIPVEIIGGLIVQLPKGTIAKVTTLDQEVDAELVPDPYDILGLSEKATDSEVESTYLRRAKSYHPDMIQAAGVPAEFIEIADLQLALINDAYERITASRKDQGGSAAERVPGTD